MTQSPRTLFSRLTIFLLPAIFVIPPLLTGCSRLAPEVVFDPTFSINIAELLPGWPNDENALAPAEEEVLRTHGRPDYFHIMWSRRSDIVDESVAHRLRRQRRVDPQKLQRRWIYMDAREEVRFAKDKLSYEVTPLSDQLEVIVRRGDPEEMRFPVVSGGRRIEKWYYWNQGLLVTFEDGRLVSEDDAAFPPSPHMMGM
jgi:hypothetical protein